MKPRLRSDFGQRRTARGSLREIACKRLRENVRQHRFCLSCCEDQRAVRRGRHEQGQYFSLDLGGSNLRVMFVKLSRQHGQVVRNLPCAHGSHDTCERLYKSYTTDT